MDIVDAKNMVDRLSQTEIRTLCICLLMKREYDGLNERIWDAKKHLDWDSRVDFLVNDLFRI